MSHQLPFYPSPTKTLLPALRKQGIRVRVRHARIVATVFPSAILTLSLQEIRQRRAALTEPFLYVQPKGGSTTVDLTFPDGTTFTGVAKCSNEDQFNRHEGIRIATMRALDKRRGETFWRRPSPLPALSDIIEGSRSAEKHPALLSHGDVISATD